MTTWAYLSLDVLGHIFSFLTPNEALRNIQVCRYWKRAFEKTLPQRTYNLCYNRKVTDEGLKHLSGVHTIYLFGTNVTDEGLKHLAKAHTIHLGWTKVTDKGLKHLSGVHTIYLYNTAVTKEGVKWLKRNGTKKILK